MANDEVVIDQVAVDAPETPQNVSSATSEPTIPEAKIKEIQNKAFGYAYGIIDQKLAEIGYEKPAGVKTTDFLIEVIKSKQSEPSTKGSDGDVETAAKIKGLQDALRQKETELEQVRNSTTVAKRDFYLDSLVSSFEIDVPTSLSDIEAKRYVERNRKMIKNELLANYDLKEVDGTFRPYTKDGSPVLDGTIDMNPIKLDNLLKRDFSEFMPKPKPTPAPVRGTGGASDTETSVGGVSIPSSVKNASELHYYLTKEKGYVMGQPEYNSVVLEAKKSRPNWFK